MSKPCIYCNGKGWRWRRGAAARKTEGYMVKGECPACKGTGKQKEPKK